MMTILSVPHPIALLDSQLTDAVQLLRPLSFSIDFLTWLNGQIS